MYFSFKKIAVQHWRLYPSLSFPEAAFGLEASCEFFVANNGPLQYPRFIKSFSSSLSSFLLLLRFFGAQCFSQSLFLLSRLPGWFSQPPVSSPMGVTRLQVGARANALSAGALHGQHLGFSQALTPS